MAGIIVQLKDGHLTASWENNVGVRVNADISSLLILGDDLEKILNPILSNLRLKKPSTIKTQLRNVNAFGQALCHLGTKSLPVSDYDWQKLIRDVHNFIITRKDSSASLKTRISSVWLTTRGCFISLMEAGVIPVSVYLPPIREALDAIDISAYQDRLIGQKAPVKVNASEKIDKLICSISLTRTDADYLDEIRDTLTTRRHLMFETLRGYWSQIKANFDFGRKLRSQVIWDDLKPLVEKIPIRKYADHPANPRNGIIGLANYLAVIQHRYGGCPPSDDDLRNLNQEFEYLPRFYSISPIRELAKKYEIPDAPYGRAGWSQRNVLWWWQGRLSHFDVSMICALLIMLHPSWTPSSIMLSRITDRHGKQYLELSDKESFYEVEKPRAKAMKRESLDPLAYEIIHSLIQEGADIREELRAKGDSRASLLFLPYGNTKISVPSPSQGANYLSGVRTKSTGTKWIWIGMVYPELLTGGLGKGTLSFVKIRNTEGVLEWFRTKSLRAVAKKLGNTEKVVLQHYIPKPIIDAWNTRMIRRFQNIWISAAAADEDFLLDISDFSSLSDLHAFLKDILKLHASTDSPLAEILHRRFDARLKKECNVSSTDDDTYAHLHVAISKGALCALYSYHATVLNLGLSEAALDKPDILTGLSPRHFLALTDILQSQLPLDKNPDYVDCHFSAIKLASDPASRLKWSKLWEV